jgi:hypothetical protein
MIRRLWLAPVLDLACLATFILVGAGRHNINDGAGWFFEVLWPLAVGWYGVALLTKLYTAPDKLWMRLAITLAGATVIMAALRGAVLDRPTVSIFTVVFVGWMVLTAFGWRLLGRFLSARRSGRAPATSA